MKLNTVLALTQTGKAALQQAITNYTKFFSKDQSAFKGFKNTYTPKDGTIDEPTKRGYQQIVTTVDEKVDYFRESNTPFITMVMDQEATNANGVARADLVVEGKLWGEFSSGELLRLKGLVENAEFKAMINHIPVRSDSEIWKKSESDEYQGREVFEKAMIQSVHKSSKKVSYILQDPNIGKIDGAKYVPQIASQDETLDLGDVTSQEFSGAWSHRQRAETLRRLEILKTAIIHALSEANDVEVIPSKLTGDKFFDFVFYGNNEAAVEETNS